MMQSIIRYAQGYVKIRVEGYSPERFLNLCRHHHIYIWGLTPCQNAYEMYMSLGGFRKIRPIVRKTHTRILLVDRVGLPFFLHAYRKRKLFFVSFVLCIVLLFLYSGFIWDIHFEGNEKWTDQTLLAFLDTKNVSPHMPKNEVDCAKIVKDIRKEYDDIVWVSASIDGSRLRIQIKENEDTFQDNTPSKQGASADKVEQHDVPATAPQNGEDEPVDLVAEKDGVITKIITRKGTPYVHIGDAVKKGDILVSGRIDVMNDAGEVVNYHYERADADILADTEMVYEDTTPTHYKEKQYEKSKRGAGYIKIGSRIISIGILKHSYKQWEMYTWERQAKLGENFYLPISYGCKTIKSYTSKEKTYSKEVLQQQLSGNFDQFSKEMMEKGIQIKGNSVKIHIDENLALAKGILNLNEPISKEANTEIIEIERNEQDESVRTDN